MNIPEPSSDGGQRQAVARGDDPARWHDRAYPEDYQGQVQRAIGFSGISHDFFIVGKARWLERGIKRFGLRPGSISLVDIGCGVGLLHPYLDKLANRIVGVDLSEDAINVARTSNPQNEYIRYSGVELPFGSDQFDLALAITVMHHVPVHRWAAFVADAHRVLRPGGALVVIEHNPLNPLTRLAVNRCEFDADAVLLGARTMMSLLENAGFHNIGTDYIFFTPFKARVVQVIEQKLRALPLGAQYVTFGLKAG